MIISIDNNKEENIGPYNPKNCLPNNIQVNRESGLLVFIKKILLQQTHSLNGYQHKDKVH